MNRVLALVLALGVFLPASAAALHRQTASLVQVTPISGAGVVENPSWAGFRYVVFDSDADIVGNGNNTRQVFLFDLRERDRTGGLAIEQLTSGPGDARRGAAGRLARRVVYDALDGGVRQLFEVERNSGDVVQLTDGSADSINARADERGRFIVFESSADFFNTGVSGTQIYMIALRSIDPSCPYPCVSTNNAGLFQITNESGTNRNAVTAKAGRAILFESNADLLNLGQTTNQVYLLEDFTALSLLGHGPGESRNPSVSRNGRQFAFESDEDLMNNGSTGTQLFARRRRTEPVEQITFEPNGTSTTPAVSVSGRQLTFVSSDDLLGNGSSGPEVFVYGIRRGDTQQVTGGPSSVAEFPAHSAGVFNVFVADGDLLGNGTSGPALYLVNLFGLGNQILP
jgi:Tol biopolymer transport system component